MRSRHAPAASVSRIGFTSWVFARMWRRSWQWRTSSRCHPCPRGCPWRFSRPCLQAVPSWRVTWVKWAWPWPTARPESSWSPAILRRWPPPSTACSETRIEPASWVNVPSVGPPPSMASPRWSTGTPAPTKSYLGAALPRQSLGQLTPASQGRDDRGTPRRPPLISLKNVPDPRSGTSLPGFGFLPSVGECLLAFKWLPRGHGVDLKVRITDEKRCVRGDAAMTITDRKNVKLFASGLCGLWLSLGWQVTPAPAFTVTPANPTIRVGQTQQFTAMGVRTPTAVSAGAFFTCVSFSDGTAQFAGRNQFGQLGNGDGTFTNSSVPVAVSGLTTPNPVVTGAEHACALLGDSTVRCWGAGDSGQRGDGTFNNSSTVPIAVVGSNGAGAFTGAVTVVTGGYHTCALLGDGTMWCWGRNAQGQLGDGTAGTGCAQTTGLCSPIPVRVGGITSPLAITAGGYHTCALLGDGTVWCWGRSVEGERGDGTPTSSSTPVRVGGITSSAVAIAAGHGGLHTCALLSDGSVKCWGALGPGNDVGQLGNGATAGSATPVTMTGTGGTAVTWTESSNGPVATIDATGLATGRGPGTTTITATAGSGASASTTLTVNPAPVAPTITTQPAGQTVTAGPTAALPGPGTG